ncbi:hypothetical protein ACIQCX_24550 [Enterobacter cancerogenus]|uniref:hypothetical protein n=1 Tax=Enterobacter cancerogenus TaxID=69218 RepID=UPI00380A62C2
MSDDIPELDLPAEVITLHETVLLTLNGQKGLFDTGYLPAADISSLWLISSRFLTTFQVYLPRVAIMASNQKILAFRRGS